MSVDKEQEKKIIAKRTTKAIRAEMPTGDQLQCVLGKDTTFSKFKCCSVIKRAFNNEDCEKIFQLWQSTQRRALLSKIEFDGMVLRDFKVATEEVENISQVKKFCSEVTSVRKVIQLRAAKFVVVESVEVGKEVLLFDYLSKCIGVKIPLTVIICLEPCVLRVPKESKTPTLSSIGLDKAMLVFLKQIYPIHFLKLRKPRFYSWHLVLIVIITTLAQDQGCLLPNQNHC